MEMPYIIVYHWDMENPHTCGWKVCQASQLWQLKLQLYNVGFGMKKVEISYKGFKNALRNKVILVVLKVHY